MSRVVAWFSAGAASAVATKVALAEHGPENFVIGCIDPGSEHPDNERFRLECEEWFGHPITLMRSERYKDTWEVFEKRRFLVGPQGALCTAELKKMVRYGFELPDDRQVFGYTAEESSRADRFREQNPGTDLWTPLIDRGLSKADCLLMIERAGIELPAMYRLGYRNNNCLGCVKGGMGYWNKIRVDFPDVFDRMARMERHLGRTVNRSKGEPVWLDEMDPNRGNYATEDATECGVACQVTEVEISTKSPAPEPEPAPRKTPVLAIDIDIRTNAELMLACRDLGYLSDDMQILDPTYGEGRFWRDWQPEGLVASDLDPAKSPVGHAVNFTWMRHADASFDAVVFDPPYKLNGTGGSHASDAAYGVADRWGGGIKARHTLIRKGITECTRVLRHRGILMVKMQDQVSSGRVHWQTREFADHAESLGHRLIDQLHLMGYREQPTRWKQCPECGGAGGNHASGEPCDECGGVGKVATGQQHARRNYSTLQVFRLERKRP